MANNIKTYVLLGVLTIILVLIGSIFGQKGMIIALVIALGLNWFSYFFGDRLVLAMYGAKEVTASDQPELQRMVEQLCLAGQLPKPRIYLIPSATPNAFATGRDPEHASVAVTRGALDLLSREELSGVLGHELTHVKNRDILIATVAATIAGAITFLARMLQWGAILGGGRDREGGGNMLGVASVLLFAVLAPIAALLVQLAISRSREYLADEGGARLCGHPMYLAGALRKLSAGVAVTPMRTANPTTASLFIVSPFAGGGWSAMFSTHPPMAERVRRLEAMK